MIEAFASIGLLCTVFICLIVISSFLELIIDKFKKWRKYNCKFKCLCKHTYKIHWFDCFNDMEIECIICGKKKVLHFERESLDIFLK